MKYLLFPLTLAFATPALAQTDETWSGYPVDENGWTDASDWLGWLFAGFEPWIYSQNLDAWLYMEEPSPEDVGAWSWHPRGQVEEVDPSLLLHITFDDGAAVDVTGKQSGITALGPVPGEGEHAGSFLFNDPSDVVRIPDFDYGPYFTVSFWFNSDDNTNANYRYMFSHGAVHVNHSVNAYFIADHNMNEGDGFGRIKTTIVDMNDDGYPMIFTQRGLSDAQWHLYTVTVHNNGMTVYIDGVEAIASTEQGGDYINPNDEITLGRRSDASLERSFTGYLDDVRIYNRPLSASEIADLFQKGR